MTIFDPLFILKVIFLAVHCYVCVVNAVCLTFDMTCLIICVHVPGFQV